MNARITASTLLALAIGLAPASADNVKLKYVLQCGAAKAVPPESDDADPVFQTRIVATTDGQIYVRHFAASGERYDRNSQYRDMKFWSESNADNWSGVSIKQPDRTMVGRLQMDKTKRWVEYVEKLYRGGKLEMTTTHICRFAEPGPVEGEKS
jgi:hypothetical protein